MAPGLEPGGMRDAQVELAGGFRGGGAVFGNGVGGESRLQSADLLPGRLRPELLREVRPSGRG